MSLVLGAWVRQFTPASTFDQLVLLHICDEILTPDATIEESLPAGKFLGPSYQTQNRRNLDGGGFLSMADLGSRTWRDVTDPKQCSDRAIARTRRLRGLPNATGQAWFPALLWQVGGGTYRDEATGRVWNRRALWRVPLIREAVLVPVPKSVQQASHPSGPGQADEPWRPETGWSAAHDLLLAARKARAVRAACDEAAARVAHAAQESGVPLGATESVVKAARNAAARRAAEAWDARTVHATVRADLAAARAVQEDQAWSDQRLGRAGDKGINVPDAWFGGGQAHADRLDVLAHGAACVAESAPRDVA